MKKHVILIAFFFFGCAKTYHSQKQELSDSVLTEEQVAAYRIQLQRTIKMLVDYLEIIKDKNRDFGTRKKSAELAAHLFMSDESMIEVISAETGEKKEIPNRSYFNSLLLLPYSNVSIKWYQYYIPTKAERGTDGKYYGVGLLCKKFIDNSPQAIAERPTDNECKVNVPLLAEKVESKMNKDTVAIWRIFLGDVAIEEAKQ